MLKKKNGLYIFSLLLALALVLAQMIPAFAAPGDTTRIDVDSNGVGGNNFPGNDSSISADGRYVAFMSAASNLVSGDTNGVDDIFVRDTLASTTTRVSVDSSGAEGNYESSNPSISANGRYVAFVSGADNLVSGDTSLIDVFVHDLLLNTTTRVSVDSSGMQGNGHSGSPSISADGRYVAFGSYANTLVSGDTNGYGVADVFLRDTLLNTTKLISVDSSGTQGNESSGDPSISADGRYVAFVSHASNLVSGDTNGIGDIFVRDTVTNTTKRVSVDSNGGQAETGGAGGLYIGSYNPSISANGRYVVFASYAYNLVSGDSNGFEDIFMHDMAANTTTRISVDSSNLGGGNSWSRAPSISADGRYVAFASSASNLVSGNTNLGNVFVRDTLTKTTMQILVVASGVEGNNASGGPSISSDGHYMVFTSWANLVDGDMNGVFIHEIPPPPIFSDVPISYWASQYIERLFNAGITGGCSVTPLNYCPDSTVTRAQMAVFLLKGIHGSNYIPPSVGANTGFDDVAADYWAAAWIKQLAAEGITGGCGAGNYCPDATVTRAQMAIFLLKAKHGSAYTPPSATGVFTDVPAGYWADKWIEQLSAEGITGGCGSGNYCPDDSVTRAQMAVFLVKAFNLP